MIIFKNTDAPVLIKVIQRRRTEVTVWAAAQAAEPSRLWNMAILSSKLVAILNSYVIPRSMHHLRLLNPERPCSLRIQSFKVFADY